MRVGVITHFHKSTNFGGNLQAYALIKALKNLGYDAEQIRYYDEHYNLQLLQNASFLRKVRYQTGKIKRAIFSSAKKDERSISFEEWQKKWVDYSKKEYTNLNIKRVAKEYDAFITGSDQVWNLKWYTPAYFLSFAPDNKTKISYSASMPKPTLEEWEKEFFKKQLKRFQAISLREEHAVSLFKDIASVPVQMTLDPTLLLSCEEWDEVASERLIKERYVLAGIYGKEDFKKQAVKAFAEKAGFKYIEFEDFKNSSPSEFISLIKYAEMIITDSFHATSFALIYKKKFCCFGRYIGSKAIGTRIECILNVFGLNHLYIEENVEDVIQTVKKIETIYQSKGSIDDTNLKILKKESIEFLKKNLH